MAAIIDDAIDLAAKDYDLRKRYDFRNINVERNIESNLPDVPVVRVEIVQVMLNLLKNAAQAMGERPDGSPPARVAISVRRDRDSIVTTVEDNGPGMPESVKRRVFEPFFTTKEPGAGTGLGMSVSYTIVTKNHGGRFSVDSEVGRGARFTLVLPLKPEPARHE
jgi:signal transduction histidine kinase